MYAERSSPSAQVLAGKRTEGPVMRNGEKRTSPREVEPTREAEGNVISLDACSISPAREQRLNALRNADDIRLHRAEIRRRLHALELDFDEFLDETPKSCLKVPVVKMLMWLPNIGRAKAKEMIASIGSDDRPASEDTRVGELDQRSKYLLSRLVEPHLGVYRRRYLAAA